MEEKRKTMHLRNKHAGRYDFDKLIEVFPGLKRFIVKNKFNGENTVDYSDPRAVKVLNRALLAEFYGIAYWNLPKGALCPAVPGRADYIHYISDLETIEGGFCRDKCCHCLDVGVGSNCIYPIIGCVEYGWTFVGTDISEEALINARKIATSNPVLSHKIDLRKQENSVFKFRNIIREGEYYDLTICNPPFHESEAAAQEDAKRKLNNLRGTVEKLNFAGVSNELWCDGGEYVFLRDMIRESVDFKNQVGCFTTLVSKERNLKGLYKVLEECGAVKVGTLEMIHGSKISRILVWRY